LISPPERFGSRRSLSPRRGCDVRTRTHRSAPDLGEAANWRYVEFFTANINNDHTRRAYARACSRFFACLVLRGKQDEKTYCLTGECSPDVERCLTARVPVASLISRPSHSSPSQF